MCLNYEEKFPVESDIGYKLFSIYPETDYCFKKGKLYAWTKNKYIRNKAKSYPLNRWLDEKDYRPDKRISTAGWDYKTGFHICKNRNAEFFKTNDNSDVICKVQFKDIVTTGIQKDSKIIVARKMKILKILTKPKVE